LAQRVPFHPSRGKFWFLKNLYEDCSKFILVWHEKFSPAVCEGIRYLPTPEVFRNSSRPGCSNPYMLLIQLRYWQRSNFG